jgi:hypothetical protein
MNEEPETPCDFAKLNYFNALKFRYLWSILVYVFGVAVALFLVASVILFINSAWLPGALVTFGAIMSSGGVTWVVNQKVTAVKEEEDAFRRLKTECKAPGMGFIGIEQQPWLADLRALAWESLLWRSTRTDTGMKS